MLANIQLTNNNDELNNDSVIGSLDVKSLYPSLDMESSIYIVCEKFYQSDICIKNIDYEELGLYLRLNSEPTQLENLTLTDVCPTRKTKFGRPPVITGSGINIHKKERFAAWKEAKQKPDQNQGRIMIREALRIVLSLIMKNHMYTFNNELKLQNSGGPIGLDLTGVLAQVFMAWWDRILLSKLREFNFAPKLYKRYVDDINICVNSSEPGMVFQNGIVRIDESLIEAEELIHKDKRTFELIKKIGDDIHKNIILETDVPSNYEDEKLPILDLKVWLEVITTENENKIKIIHEHYQKSVSSKLLIHKESATPNSVSESS